MFYCVIREANDLYGKHSMAHQHTFNLSKIPSNKISYVLIYTTGELHRSSMVHSTHDMILQNKYKKICFIYVYFLDILLQITKVVLCVNPNLRQGRFNLLFIRGYDLINAFTFVLKYSIGIFFKIDHDIKNALLFILFSSLLPPQRIFIAIQLLTSDL